jgi:hypothetical protein
LIYSQTKLCLIFIFVADVSLSQQVPPPEPYASPPLKTAADTPPKKPKIQPKPVELIAPQKEPVSQ